MSWMNWSSSMFRNGSRDIEIVIPYQAILLRYGVDNRGHRGWLRSQGVIFDMSY